MSLAALSEGYLHSALLLRARLSQLRREVQSCPDAEGRAALRHRIAILAAMQTQCYELAELTAHYYERGFYRDERYTL